MTHAHASAHAGEHHGLAHVASAKSLLTVFGLLIVLTGLTVVVARLGLGQIDIWIAMLIATIKATLVGLYFMHLRHDKPFNAIVFLSSFLFVSLFLGFTLIDTFQYAGSLK